ncbi:hypothetical protein UlMin_038809 [Ulmus minor]
MADSKKLHIALFPWLAFGHIIPFLELAKKIAQKGHTVSFISTPKNIKRLPKIPQNLSPSINLVQLPFPRETNLPQNAEATIDVPYNLVPYLKKAYDGLQNPLAHFLETNTPDWIIYDFAPHWLPSIAEKLGVSRAFYFIFNASTVCFFGPTPTDLVEAYGPRTKPEDFTFPPKWIPFPSDLACRPFEAKKLFDNFNGNDSGVSDIDRLRAVVNGCDVYLIRSCREIEDSYLELLQELCRKPVLPTGLLPFPAISTGQDKDSTWETIVEWLNKQVKGSVVYVALGSEVRPSQEDFNELAHGLELSGLPFFWALRKSNGLEDGGLVKLPDGFEERTKGRGIVWTSWAPQQKILAHESVGGFLTHCGWGSIVEGLQLGLPLIMLPYITDQGINARVYGKKVGLEILRDEEDGLFTGKSVAETIRKVVVEEEGKGYRERAKKMSEIFGDEVLQDRYVDKCVEYFETKCRG